MDYYELKHKMYELGKKINVDKKLYPTMKYGYGSECKYIEISNNYFIYTCMERGTIIFRKRYTNVDDLLFEIFYNITSEISTMYEIRNRVENQDPRRLNFQKRVELMTQIKKDYGEKCQKRLSEILENYPYSDGND